MYDQGVPVLLPTISAYFGLSTFQISALHALRFSGVGVVNIGGGLVVDMMKSRWGLMLTGCMVSAAIFFALLAAAPGYLALLLIVPLVSIPGALWHLPSAASLSQIFSDRRGFAISIHGFGANLGNLTGPIIAAGLLALFASWRGVILVYTIPAMVMGVIVWIYLKDVGKIGAVEPRGLVTQLRETARIARNPTVLILVGSAMLRGVGLDAIFAWSPFYLSETLDMHGLNYGIHMSLLTGMGIVSAPALGYLSDRFSRKAVVIPGFVLATALSFVTVAAGDGLPLTLVLAGTGLFSFALHQIVLAMVLDVVGRGTEATAVGLIFGLNGILGAISPFIAAVVIRDFGGYGSIYYFAGILTALSTILIIAAPAGKRS